MSGVASQVALFVVMLTVAAGAARAGQDDSRVRAATEAARANLRASVDAERIRPALSIRQFVEQAGAEEEMTEALARAEPVGRPRWVDDQVCQVRVELPAATVARALVRVAADRGAKSPATADAVELSLSDWQGRTFAAVGTNAEVAAAPTTAPASPAPVDVLYASDLRWSDRLVDAGGTAQRSRSRLHTARAAEAAAVKVLRSQVDAVRTGDGRTIGELVAADPRVDTAVRRAMAQARVTKVDFAGDGGAAVRMSLDLAVVFRELSDLR